MDVSERLIGVTMLETFVICALRFDMFLEGLC